MVNSIYHEGQALETLWFSAAPDEEVYLRVGVRGVKSITVSYAQGPNSPYEVAVVTFDTSTSIVPLHTLIEVSILNTENKKETT